MELYRQLLSELSIHRSSNSKTIMLRLIKKEITDLVLEKKMKVVLIVDEASMIDLTSSLDKISGSVYSCRVG